MHGRFGRMLAAALVAVVVVAACSDDDEGTTTASTTSQVAPVTTVAPDGAPHDVGVMTETFVDTTRPTPKSGDVAARPERLEAALRDAEKSWPRLVVRGMRALVRQAHKRGHRGADRAMHLRNGGPELRPGDGHRHTRRDFR